METLHITLWILGISIFVSFVYGLVTRNYSTVDRLWSVLPAVYVIVWMIEFGYNLSFILPAVLVILWGIRLTINFAIKGGYNFSFKRGFYGEDYRWDILKKKIPNRFLFEIFNLFFICIFQLALIFGFTLPLYYFGKLNAQINLSFYIVLIVHVLLLIMETIADIQQFSYYKKRGKEEFKNNPRMSLGFNTYGLWKYSRHPNYVCEMGQWICVYLYLHLAYGFHWSGIFALLLVLLFIGSTRMAEQITLSKYPEYADWKKATPPWLPFIDWFLRIKHRKKFIKKFNL